MDIKKLAGDLKIPRDVKTEWDKTKNGTIPTGNLVLKMPYIGTLRIEESRFGETINQKPDKPKPNHPAHSRLRVSQTLREFFDTIDRILTELGILDDLKNIRDELQIFRKRFYTSERKDDQEKMDLARIKRELHERINALLTPVYWKLRILGYNRYPDLAR